MVIARSFNFTRKEQRQQLQDSDSVAVPEENKKVKQMGAEKERERKEREKSRWILWNEVRINNTECFYTELNICFLALNKRMSRTHF